MKNRMKKNEKFLRITCLFYFENEFKTKNTCFEHIRHSNIHAKNAHSK